MKREDVHQRSIDHRTADKCLQLAIPSLQSKKSLRKKMRHNLIEYQRITVIFAALY